MRGGLTVAVVVGVLVAGVLAGVPSGAGAADPVRYLDRVFDEVQVTSGIEYRPAGYDGVSPAQLLDLYEPKGDPATARPLVVWLHGYGPASMGRADVIDAEVATRFAKHGAVVASIDYRVFGDGPDDAQAAVAWFRAHAETYRIDVDRIAVAGASAGAQRAIRMGYQDDITLGLPAPERRVRAVLSFAGDGPGGMYQPGEPPLFMAHGELDINVPFASAVATCEAANASGVACELRSFPTADHIGLFLHADEIESMASAWLYDVLDLANAEDPPLPPTSAPSTPPVTEPTTTGPATSAPPATVPPSTSGPVTGPTRTSPPVSAPIATPVATVPTFAG